MKLISYLKGRIIFIISQMLIILFLIVLFDVLEVNQALSALVCMCILLITIATLAVEYFQRHYFYRELNKNLENLEKKFYITSMLEEPEFIEGEILIDTLRQTTKSMNDEVAFYRRMNMEYQEYIEAWIHEIKIPIACIDLICENNRGEIVDGIKDELSRIDGYVEQALYFARSTKLEKDYLIRQIKLDSLVKSTLKKYSKQLIAARTVLSFDNLSLTVYGDPKWLEFILGQLISNSIKYKKDTLKLHFSAREEKDNIILEENLENKEIKMGEKIATIL